MKKVEHKIEVYPFSFNKFINNARKIDIRPYRKSMRDISVGDVVCYVNIETKEEIRREIEGIALFNDFETAIKMLDEHLIGYDTKDEIKIRVERMYNKDEVNELGVVAFFVEELKVSKMMSLRQLERVA